MQDNHIGMRQFLFFGFQAQRLWSGARPEPSGEWQVVLGRPNEFYNVNQSLINVVTYIFAK